MEGLLGRGEERSRLDEILARARQGHSAALVIRGEPGVGKTALLDYTQAAAAGMQVIRVDAVETEMQLSFAALHQLLRPGLAILDSLPAPQPPRPGARSGTRRRAGPENGLVPEASLRRSGTRPRSQGRQAGHRPR